jgi:acyl-CoA synthetase (AMP-forming)/AMP-acid ligase II
MVQSKFLTLECCTASVSDTPAIIAVSSKSVLTLTHNVLRTAVSSFQTKLSVAGITTGDTVAVCLPNSAEFVVAFLGTVLQRAVSAPLNSAYKQEEFEFYLEDLKPKLVLVPRGAIFQDLHIIRAARRVGVPMAEVFWASDGATLLLELTEKPHPQRIASVQKPQSSDIALVLHTSGTTGTPKAVS